ncbi:MAG: D-alanyl-D-alanine carboxypeptidase [Azonexus sp.]|jgi:D-alanyl-D-alanine carboxypeptidase (penicillin-binding protein 5/6)|uniref:D-alanyl-D-alanine carboxypeptidase family protein n=1 Tax=Azonexus sp. TaxID=1872668 RepID=UPI002824002F|nr:D-alanyl-D-alanine carboxypeptidase family protein [Azonexus sp.]MDR0775847.1 D-alanyl-D-alanine carboxypeptidase [Azonexus sp.]
MSLFRQAFLVLAALLCAPLAIAQVQPVAPSLAAKSWLLMEIGSGQILSAEKPDEKLDPASLTKLMTAYLTFSALRQKTLSLDQTLPVSEKAWRTGGSKMWVRVGHQVRVDDLLKGMIVQSGNDACVVLAEGIAGSEENFAQMMNREAQRLGMNNSSFRNASGLSDPQHFSTARDLSLLASALIRDFPEEYSRYYSMKEFSYSNIKQPNRNRLLWLDPSVDGVKTGHTEAAGYCLIASALRGPRRLLSVVLGTASDATRINESQKLLNWGFAAWETVPLYAKDQAAFSPRVWKGAQNQVKAGFASDFIITVPKGMADKIKAELVAPQPLMAPVQAGQQIGTLKLSLDGEAYGDYPVYALESVPLAGVVGRAVDTVKLWFN